MYEQSEVDEHFTSAAWLADGHCPARRLAGQFAGSHGRTAPVGAHTSHHTAERAVNMVLYHMMHIH